MKCNFPSIILLALVTGSFMSACGSGTSSGVAPGGSNPTSADAATTSVGTITGFGSVHVNGIHYRTNNATQITMDGSPSNENALQVGQVVTVHGSIDADGRNGDADSISMEEEVRGPIESISANEFSVLGQSVLINSDTLFDRTITPADLTGLIVGDLVEVSGFRDANNAIVATFVERGQAGEEFEVQGAIENLDAAVFTFSIGGLMIDYSAAQLSGFSGGAPMNAQVVEVEGTAFSAARELIATRVQLQELDDIEGNDDGDNSNGNDQDTDLEGLVTRFVSATDFDVAGHAVSTTGTTRYEHGSEASVALNVRVEVDGKIDTAGVLIATSIEFRGVNDLEVSGNVEAISVSTVTVLGIAIQVDANTAYRDDSAANLRTFSLADVVVGDHIAISGTAVVGVDHAIQASKIRRRDASATVKIDGPIASVVNTDVVVLGVTIGTDAATHFEGRNGQSVNATDFFAQLLVGDFVTARGTSRGSNSVLASQIELEDSEDD